MANEKYINSRQQQKHDLEINWLKAVNFIPKEGEIIIYDAEEEGNYEQITRTIYDENEFESYTEQIRDYWITYPRIKIGNGIDNPETLPFVKDSEIGKNMNFYAEVFNDYENNIAIGDYSHAEGQNNLSGIKGYRILDFHIGEEGNWIKLDTESTDNFYEIEDCITIMCTNAKYPNCSIITNNKTFTFNAPTDYWHLEVDNLPFTEFDLSKNYYLYVLTKPNEGNALFGNGAHAEGYETKAFEFASHAEGLYTQAIGQYSHAEGDSTQAIGHNSHAEGYNNQAISNYSHVEGMSNVVEGHSAHAEGRANKALGSYSHVEGHNNIAQGANAHAEGEKTQAIGQYSHAEGYLTQALSSYDHAEGYKTTANAGGAHAEGRATTANGLGSHAEGINTTADGEASHTEGKNTSAVSEYSHAEGYNTKAEGVAQHVQGQYNIIDSSYAHIIGNGTSSTKRSNAHTIDWDGNAWFAGKVSDKDGQLLTQQDLNEYATKNDLNSYTTKTDLENYVVKTELNNYVVKTDLDNYTTNDDLTNFGKTLYITAGKTKASTIGTKATAEGHSTVSSGTASHAEGYNTIANNNYAHAEGRASHAEGISSHAEGNSAYAIGNNSHAEGLETQANAADSHAEGYGSITKVSGAAGDYWASHAEGKSTIADGAGAHSEGYSTIASGTASHAEGYNTGAKGLGQHVEGRYNIIDVKRNSAGQMLNSKNQIVSTIEEAAANDKYVHIIGNGTTEENRSNAHTIDWSGNAWFSGNVKVGGTGDTDANAKILATQEYVDNKIAEQGTIDTNSFATKDYVDNKINEINIVDFVTQDNLNNLETSILDEVSTVSSNLTNLEETTNAQIISLSGQLNDLDTKVENLATNTEETFGDIYDQLSLISGGTAAEDYIIAKGFADVHNGQTCYWRKWNSGIAESWIPFVSESIYSTEDDGDLNMIIVQLPFEYVQKEYFITGNGYGLTFNLGKESIIFSFGELFSDNLETYWKIGSEIAEIHGTIYVLGHWK